MNMVHKANYKILYNRKIAPGYFLMGLEADGLDKSARPGQFVHIRCSDGFEPLLRRPFSIHRVKGHLGAEHPEIWHLGARQGSRVKGLEILYEVVGRGTKLLSKMKRGNFVDVLGPLGSGFKLPPYTLHPTPYTLLIAGGMGIAPLVFLAEELARQRIKTTVFIGAKTKRLILCEGIFKRLGAEVHIATDDGTYGFKGFVSGLFNKKLLAISHKPLAVYACGPKPMLRQIAELCTKDKIPCQVSLDENMGCGIGACLGCVVKTKYGYRRVCKDGPVFDAEEILWDV